MCFLLHSLRNGGCTRGPHPGRSSPPGLGIRTGPGKLEANRKRASLLSPGVCAFLRKGPAGETARIAGDRLGWDRWGPRTGEGPGKTRSLFPKTPKIPVCPFPRKKNPLGTQPRPHPGGLQGAPIPPTDSPLPPPRHVLSIPVGAPLNQAPGYHQSLPAASYKHLFILHRPQCHLPFPFASLYILLVFYPSL